MEIGTSKVMKDRNGWGDRVGASDLFLLCRIVYLKMYLAVPVRCLCYLLGAVNKRARSGDFLC